MRPGPVFGVAHRTSFDRIGDEVRDRLDDGVRGQQRVNAAASAVEDFLGPATIGLGAQKSHVSMESLQELRILATHVGDDFVDVRRHQARRMDQDPMQVRRMGEPVPIELFHLTGVVRTSLCETPAQSADTRCVFSTSVGSLGSLPHPCEEQGKGRPRAGSAVLAESQGSVLRASEARSYRRLGHLQPAGGTLDAPRDRCCTPLGSAPE